MTIRRYKTAYVFVEASQLYSICVRLTIGTPVSAFLGCVGSPAVFARVLPAHSLTLHCPLHLRFGRADSENPDLREYAIIALRNLLHNNPENQAVVNTFQADKHVGPDVVVRHLGAK